MNVLEYVLRGELMSFESEGYTSMLFRVRGLLCYY